MINLCFHSSVTFSNILVVHCIIIVNFCFSKCSVYTINNTFCQIHKNCIMNYTFANKAYYMYCNSTIEFLPLKCCQASNLCIINFYFDLTWRIIMLCFYVTLHWRGMLAVEFDRYSRLDVVFSEAKLNTVLYMYGTG